MFKDVRCFAFDVSGYERQLGRVNELANPRQASSFSMPQVNALRSTQKLCV